MKSNHKVYETTFEKINGDKRKIKYVSLPDLPTGFLDYHVKGGFVRPLGPGFDRVWDVEYDAFRTVNTNRLDYQPKPAGTAVFEDNQLIEYV